MSANKRKGTAWESQVVAYLRDRGWMHVERRALNGAKDRGDVAGIPGLVVECKAASRHELAAWVDEAKTERDNDGAKYGVVWVKRRGKGTPRDAFVVMDGDTFADLLAEAGY